MTPVRRLLSALISTPTLLGCSAGQALAPGPSSLPATAVHAEKLSRSPASPAENERLDILMYRSACFGRCPSYSVRLDANDNVEFKSERFTAATGVQHGSAVPSKVQELRVLLTQPGMASLDGDYTPANAKACGRWATDFASVKIEITGSSFPRRIHHYLGCEAAPKELLSLEKAIDDATGSERWISGSTIE